MIIGEIKRLIRGSNSLRVARSIRDTAYKVLQARSKIEAEKDDVATMAEIAETLGTQKCMNIVLFGALVNALDAISDPVSLYDPVYNKNGDELLVMDQISDEKNNIDGWTENVALEGAISNLNEREKKILYMRYYEGKTQTEISAEVGLSQAQVSRLEKNALKTVKNKIS